MDVISLYFDGASRPSGQSGIGFVVRRAGKTLANIGTLTEGQTNNEAEYASLIAGLQYCLAHGYRRIEVRGDSQLVIRQMSGKYKCRAANLLPLHQQAKTLARKFDSIAWHWIPRQKNKLADAATRDLMTEDG